MRQEKLSISSLSPIPLGVIDHVWVIPSIDLAVKDGDKIWIIVELATEGWVETVALGVVDNPWMIPAVTLGVEDELIVVVASGLHGCSWVLLWHWSHLHILLLWHGSRLLSWHRSHLLLLLWLRCISSPLGAWHHPWGSAVAGVGVGLDVWMVPAIALWVKNRWQGWIVSVHVLLLSVASVPLGIVDDIRMVEAIFLGVVDSIVISRRAAHVVGVAGGKHQG